MEVTNLRQKESSLHSTEVPKQSEIDTNRAISDSLHHWPPQHPHKDQGIRQDRRYREEYRPYLLA